MHDDFPELSAPKCADCLVLLDERGEHFRCPECGVVLLASFPETSSEPDRSHPATPIDITTKEPRP